MSVDSARLVGRLLQGLGLGAALFFALLQWLLSAGGLGVFRYQGF